MVRRLDRILPRASDAQLYTFFGYFVRWTVLIGCALYCYLAMPNILDTPFSELTLRIVGDALVKAGAISLVLVVSTWKGKPDYEAWGQFGWFGLWAAWIGYAVWHKISN
jgi:hypothetical protein